MNQLPPAFWSLSATEMLERLQTAKEGLTGGEAGQRLMGIIILVYIITMEMTKAIFYKKVKV